MSRVKLRPGQIVRFTYRTYIREAAEEPGDVFKEVFVLHPGWQGRVHGIDLKRLTAAERVVIDAIFDPKSKETGSRIPLVNDILKRMDPIEEIKNPVSFYSKFVKVFLRDKDAYRTYYPLRMLNVVVAEQTTTTGGVFNPKPLFHKVESKTVQEPEKTPPGAINRLDIIKQRAQQKQQAASEPKTPIDRMVQVQQARSKQPAPVDRMALLKQRQAALQGKTERPVVQRPQLKKPPRPR